MFSLFNLFFHFVQALAVGKGHDLFVGMNVVLLLQLLHIQTDSQGDEIQNRPDDQAGISQKFIKGNEGDHDADKQVGKNHTDAIKASNFLFFIFVFHF